ncbi:glycosyltransferase family 39 protein [Neisseriaceae bacterium TC5R-5]|nr:glycosyltransferase family 39 protein [Neisseriaceae bacterium TC5R-5]
MSYPSFYTTRSGTSLPPLLEPILWLLFAVIWFASLAYRDLIHADEGRYAMLSLGMLQSGDWITPRLNGLLYFEKPVLQYWLGAISFALFGINDFAARFWPGLSGFLSVVILSYTARRLWGVEAGRYAALTAAGCTWLIANSHFLSLDMGVSFFLTLTLCSFLLAQYEQASPRQTRFWMLICWAAMAGATLSKGLIGLLIPGASLVLYSVLNWQWTFWRRMHWLSGICLFLLLAAPWFVLVSQRNPGFAHFFFIHEHVERFLTTEHRRGGPLWYFVPYLLVGLLPWTTLLPNLIKENYARHYLAAGLHCGRLLLIWAGFVFLFFSKSGSKLPSYILPMFPALILLLANSLQQLSAARLKKHIVLPVLLWLAVLLAYPFLDKLVPSDVPLEVVRAFAQFLLAAAIIFILCALLAWRSLSQDRVLLALALLSFGSLSAVTLASFGHDHYGRMKSSRHIVQSIRPYLHTDTPVYSVRYYDQTFPFYLQRPVTLVDFVDEFAFGEQQEPARWIPELDTFIQQWQAAPSAVAMLNHETYQQLKQQGVTMQVVYEDLRRIVIIKPEPKTKPSA